MQANASGKGGLGSLFTRANTNLRFPIISNGVSVPLILLLRDWGLEVEEDSEHSVALTWHGIQVSSSSLRIHRVPEY